MTSFAQRIFSGIQPTGSLHLGNYLGAMRNWARLQNDYECLFCVVDMHAITVWQDPKTLRHNTREAVAAIIAAGVDHKQHIIFNQSQVSGHAELAWIFNCIARMGWMARMTQFKEKAGKNREQASVGLFSYPVLMAADILLYKGTHVPVGEDQKQHLELARDIAQKFNNDYECTVFPLPEPMILGEAKRVMSLKDGTAKMSKSDPSDYSRINMRDNADTIVKKIKKAKTDPMPLPDTIEALNGRAEATNLLNLYAALADISLAETIHTFAGNSFAHFKQQLADVAINALTPVQATFNDLMEHPDHIDSILTHGAEQAHALSHQTMREVHHMVGFLSTKRSLPWTS